jgi:hypothetical protein
LLVKAEMEDLIIVQPFGHFFPELCYVFFGKPFPDKTGKIQTICFSFKLYAQNDNGISMVPFSLELFNQFALFPDAGTG